MPLEPQGCSKPYAATATAATAFWLAATGVLPLAADRTPLNAFLDFAFIFILSDNGGTMPSKNNIFQRMSILFHPQNKKINLG